MWPLETSMFVIRSIFVSSLLQNRRRTIEMRSKCLPKIRPDASRWVCWFLMRSSLAGEPRCVRNENRNFFFFKTFLGLVSLFPCEETIQHCASARAAATAASSSLFFFLSFPLRSRKFVFVSKSGRLALKKKRLRFRYRRNRIARAYCNSILSSLIPRSDFAFASF